MQDRVGSVFMLATANDVSALPPELLRKGRFDELFFVDLPTVIERGDILRAALKSHGRSDADIDIGTLAVAAHDFTGAELAALIPDAMYEAFADGEREIRTADISEAIRGTVPLAKTAAEKIAALRTWAKTRARPASKTLEEFANSNSRVLDI